MTDGQHRTGALTRRGMLKGIAGLGGGTAAVGIGGFDRATAHTADLHVTTQGTVRAQMQQMPPLDPQMQAVIDELMALEAPKLTEMNPFNARQTSPLTLAVQAVLTRQSKPPFQPVGNVAHRLIPGGAGQQMLIRIYQPAGEGPFPTLVYFHGGGWVIANLDTYDSSCRALVNAANCAVVSVAYQQAPENTFPAAPEDAFVAYQWVRQNAALIRTDPNRIAVGGESAGGNLATVTTLIARDRGAPLPVHQMLIYPITNYDFSTLSYRAFTDILPLNTPAMQYFWNNYLRHPADGANPYASPLRANLRGLPPATVITAEFDPCATRARRMPAGSAKRGCRSPQRATQALPTSFSRCRR